MTVFFRRALLLSLIPLANAFAAGNNSYYRGLGLVEEDPLEADALLSAALKTTTNDRIRRAARYDLFYLRLRLGRFVEAYPLASTKSMRRKFVAAAAPQLRIPEARFERLLSALDRECAAREDGDAGRVGEWFAKTKNPAALYDFAYRRLEACKVAEPEGIFPAMPEKVDDMRIVQIRLVAERLTAANREYSENKQALAALREASSSLSETSSQLAVQLDLAEARLAALAGQMAETDTTCARLRSTEGGAFARRACAYLRGYAALKSTEYARADKILSVLKVEPREIDNRLLKVMAAVAAGRTGREKLRRFMKRASFRYNAAPLRNLAEEISAAKSENNP